MNYVEPIRNKEDVELISNELSPRYSLIWSIGTQIGIRVSDILNFTVDYVEKDVIEIHEQKTGKRKKFPVNESLKAKIKNYYNEFRATQYVKKGYEKYLFVGRKGCKLDRSQVYREIKKVCEEQGIDVVVGTHTMRKTFGYHHYKQFNDVALLQTILNHSSPQITLRYIGITQDEINNSYRKFCLSAEAEIMQEQAKELRMARNTLRHARWQERKDLKDLIENIVAEQNKKVIKALNKNKTVTAGNVEKKSTPLAEEVLKILKHQAKHGSLKLSNMAKFILQTARDNLQIEIVK